MNIFSTLRRKKVTKFFIEEKVDDNTIDFISHDYIVEKYDVIGAVKCRIGFRFEIPKFQRQGYIRVRSLYHLQQSDGDATILAPTSWGLLFEQDFFRGQQTVEKIFADHLGKFYKAIFDQADTDNCHCQEATSIINIDTIDHLLSIYPELTVSLDDLNDAPNLCLEINRIKIYLRWSQDSITINGHQVKSENSNLYRDGFINELPIKLSASLIDEIIRTYRAQRSR